jgi:hypothetical protein
MQLVHKFFAGFHHYILWSGDMSPRELHDKLVEITEAGYEINVDKATRWVSFRDELEAIEFKLKFS